MSAQTTIVIWFITIAIAWSIIAYIIICAVIITDQLKIANTIWFDPIDFIDPALTFPEIYPEDINISKTICPVFKDYCDDRYCKSQVDEMRSLLNQSVNPCVDFFGYACGNWHAKYGKAYKNEEERQNKTIFDEIKKALKKTGIMMGRWPQTNFGFCSNRTGSDTLKSNYRFGSVVDGLIRLPMDARLDDAMFWKWDKGYFPLYVYTSKVEPGITTIIDIERWDKKKCYLFKVPLGLEENYALRFGTRYLKVNRNISEITREVATTIQGNGRYDEVNKAYSAFIKKAIEYKEMLKIKYNRTPKKLSKYTQEEFVKKYYIRNIYFYNFWKQVLDRFNERSPVLRSKFEVWIDQETSEYMDFIQKSMLNEAFYLVTGFFWIEQIATLLYYGEPLIDDKDNSKEDMCAKFAANFFTDYFFFAMEDTEYKGILERDMCFEIMVNVREVMIQELTVDTWKGVTNYYKEVLADSLLDSFLPKLFPRQFLYGDETFSWNVQEAIKMYLPIFDGIPGFLVRAQYLDVYSRGRNHHPLWDFVKVAPRVSEHNMKLLEGEGRKYSHWLIIRACWKYLRRKYGTAFKGDIPFFIPDHFYDTFSADLGKLRHAYRAYKLFQKKRGVCFGGPRDFTPDQTFFLVYVQQFCEQEKTKDQRNTRSNPSADEEILPAAGLRVENMLKSYSVFRRAFQCKKGDELYDPEFSICRLW